MSTSSISAESINTISSLTSHATSSLGTLAITGLAAVGICSIVKLSSDFLLERDIKQVAPVPNEKKLASSSESSGWSILGAIADCIFAFFNAIIYMATLKWAFNTLES